MNVVIGCPARSFFLWILLLVFLLPFLASAAGPDSTSFGSTVGTKITDVPFRTLSFGAGASTIGITGQVTYLYGGDNVCIMAEGNYQFEKDPFGQHYEYAFEAGVLFGGYFQKENVIALALAGINYTFGQTRGPLLYETHSWLFGDWMVQRYSYEPFGAVGVSLYSEVMWMTESKWGICPFFSINSVAQRTLTMAGINMRVFM